MVHATSRRVVRSGYPRLSRTIILFEFSLRINTAGTCASAEHAIALGCSGD